MALTIVATVGLGVGATTAMFAAVHAALIRPLPYPDPGRLVRIYTDSPPHIFRFSVVDYQALEAQQSHFERVAAYTGRSMAFSDGATAEQLRGKEVTWTYFSVLGVRPAIGRDFGAADAKPGQPPAVIVSDAFWRRRLAEEPGTIGRPVRLDGRLLPVIGVLPPAPGPLEHGWDFFIVAQWEPPARKGPFLYTAIGRLRKDADRSAAAEELRAINRRIFPLWRQSYQDERATWSMMDLQTAVVGDTGTTVGLALAAVGLVWLIACANASSLLTARVTSRRRELAVRAALGASRGRVVGHLIAESGLLAAAAAAFGLALAHLGTGIMRESGSAYFARAPEIGLDGTTLWVLGGLAAVSTLLFGLIPAAHGTGGRLDESLRLGGQSVTGSPKIKALRQLLVAGQFAIATPLLVVAVLLLASLSALGRVDLGFDTRNVVGGSILLPASNYPEAGQVESFWRQLEERVATLPGVTAVAFADGRPPDDVGNFNNFDLEARPTPPGESQPVTPWVSVTPEYFPLLGVTLLEGRLLDDRDARRPDLESVVVDRAWARRFFPRANAIGQRFREGGCTTCPWTTVVGIVSDVKYAGLDGPNDGAVYWPMPPGQRTRYLMLRTSISVEVALRSVREAIRELDPNVPFADVATIDELVARSLQRPRSLAFLVGAFAIVALLLSVVGIYGVMAYYVQQSSKDISVRLALGGNPGDVLRVVIGHGMKVVAAGIAAGAALAVALTRFISTLLFDVASLDVRAFAGTAVFMLTVALLACVIPAIRAIRLEPAAVLRSE
jgi:putative ABC transport system permease protein